LAFFKNKHLKFKKERDTIMASVLDVAAYILEQKGAMTTWKLQKLVYYCQAWSLVWDEDILFPEAIEAWANGPVVRELYNKHRGQFHIGRVKRGNPESLLEYQRDTIDGVLNFYGDKSPQWLSDLTHMEDPWKLARKGIPDGDRGEAIISKKSLKKYYASL